MQQTSWRSTLAKILSLVFLFLLTTLIVITSGAYFLTPYYSIREGETQYNGPFTSPWKPGSYLLSLKTVTRDLSVTIKDYDLEIYLLLGFRSNFTEQGNCPPGFNNSLDHNQWPCEYLQQVPLNFIAFSPTYDTLAPSFQGLASRPTDIHQRIFDITEERDSLSFFIEIFRFAKGENSHCSTLDDCLPFIEDVVRNEENVPYIDGSFRCFGPQYAQQQAIPRTGCAVGVRLGNKQECFPQASYTLDCDFAVFVSYFRLAASMYRIAGMWEWGSIAFIIALFLWLSVSLFHAHTFHKWYRKHYLLVSSASSPSSSAASSRFHLQENCWYDLKITLVGQQFTKRDGVIRIVHVVPPSSSASSYEREESKIGTPLFEYPIKVVFGEEEIENEKKATVKCSTSFLVEEETWGDWAIEWSKEWTSSDMTLPDLYIEVRQREPWGAKSRWCIIFGPLFYFIGYCRGKHVHTVLLKPFEYFCLMSYIVTIHLAWVMVVVFTSFFFSSSKAIREVFWGTMEGGSTLSLVFSALFMFDTCCSFLFAWVYGGTFSDVYTGPPFFIVQRSARQKAKEEEGAQEHGEMLLLVDLADQEGVEG